MRLLPGWFGRAGAATLLALAGTAGAQMPASDGLPQSGLERTTLSVGMYRIDAQLARTPDERATGLMYRRSLPDYEGMLFIFNTPGVQCFWMKNTLVPLTAAFVADDGTIVNLADMQPLDETSHCSDKPVRYVLEMNQGWFATRHLEAGQRLHGGPFTAPRGH